MQIDIFSDVVCPWCFIGKRHLESALRDFAAPAGTPIKVSWHPFQLNPDLPQQGIPRAEYVNTKFGGAQRAEQIYARVAQAGQAAGIDFAFDKITRQPNTLAAHRLIHYAERLDRQDELVEQLFQSYFLRGADLTQSETLLAIAQQAGMRADETAVYLTSDEDQQLVAQSDQRARAMGIQGVPFFIFNQRLAVSGAQPPQVLLGVMQQALQPSEELAEPRP